MKGREALKATWPSVAASITGIAALFSARYAVGLFLSRRQCDQRTIDNFLWTNSYSITQATPVAFAVASIFLALNWKSESLATNLSRLTFLLASLLCITQLATLNLTFSDGVFFTSCWWEDWNDLEETYVFVVFPLFFVATVFAGLIGLNSLFRRMNPQRRAKM